MTGVAISGLRVARSSLYSDVLGLQSNFQSSFDLPPSPLMSKPYSQPSPPAKIACSTPPSTPHAGDDHCPCMILLAGDLSLHSTSPVILFIARKLGAFGWATTLCASSTPLDVLTSSTSPQAVTEQLHALCGDAPSLPIMST